MPVARIISPATGKPMPVAAAAVAPVNNPPAAAPAAAMVASPTTAPAKLTPTIGSFNCALIPGPQFFAFAMAS